MLEPEALASEVARLQVRVRELERGVHVDPVALSIAENTPSNIMLLDTDGRIQYINHIAPGLTREQVLGSSVLDYVACEFHAPILQAFRNVLETRAPDRYETAVTLDRHTTWWESSVGPVVRDGKIVGLAVVSTNVTEQRRRIEEEERFFNLSVDMLCVAGFDGYLKRVNPAFTALVGFDSELVEKPFLEFVHQDDRERTRLVMQRLEQGEVVMDFENRYLCKGGDFRLLSWRAVADTAREFIYAVARDVTDKRTLEERLRQAQKMEAIGQLAGGVAHDFNNLLLAIQGNIEIAMRGKGRGLTHHLGEALKASERAAALTRQLLAFSRQQPLMPVPLCVAKVLGGLMDLLRRLIPENIELELAAPASVAPIVADRSQLEQVVINLCVNARDAIPDGGCVTLSVRDVVFGAEFLAAEPRATSGAYVELAVADTGVGIAPEAKSRLFEPFYTTKAPGQGTGLGLATVYGVVQQHGGFIEVESTPGLGSTFKVYLPAAPGLGVESSNSEGEELASGSEVILVAEDDYSVRSVVVQVLTEAGYQVLTADNGTRAVELFSERSRQVSLLLLDVMMPGLDGPSVARQIRKGHPGVKVLFTSGYVDTAFDAVQLAHEEILQKPYRPAELLRRVREVLDAG